MRLATLLVVSGLAVLASGCSSKPKPEQDKPPEPLPPPPPPKKKKADDDASSRPVDKKPAGEAPAVTEAELSKAKSFYARGELDQVAKAMPGLSRPERPNMPELEKNARLLVRRTALLLELVSTITKSPLATGKGIENVGMASGGHVIGRVTDMGEKVKVQSFGQVEVEASEDDVVSRVRLSQEEYEAVVRGKLQDLVGRVKPDDALGYFRCAYYAWTYGIAKDAMPHLDSLLGADGFPIVVQVFARKKASGLVTEWCAVTGHAPPQPRAAPPPPPPADPSPSKPPEPTPPVRPSDPAPPVDQPRPDPTPAPRDPPRDPVGPARDPGPVTAVSPPSNDPPDPARLKKARELFDQGMAKYKASFGDGRDQDKVLREAKSLLENARDQVEQATNGHESTDDAEDLRSQIQSLLYDVRKRSRI